MRAKRIFLNVLAESSEGAQDGVVYRDALLAILGGGRSEGYTVAQIRTRVTLMDSLTTAISHWDVEYREHENLVKELEGRKWLKPSANLLKFIDDIRDAPDAIAKVPDNVVEFANTTE